MSNTRLAHIMLASALSTHPLVQAVGSGWHAYERERYERERREYIERGAGLGWKYDIGRELDMSPDTVYAMYTAISNARDLGVSVEHAARRALKRKARR
jgi:hypothetical protein